MIRHPQNTNLILHHHSDYLGYPVQTERGPLVQDYLDRLHSTLNKALDQYPRVFAFRFDLRIPVDMHDPEYHCSNAAIDRFIESFKAKIRHNRQTAQIERTYIHDSKVRYVWARELGQHGRPHYHFVIFLNYDAFCALGVFAPDRDNMFNRLQDAWASALGLSVAAVGGLVEIPPNPSYRLHRNDTNGISNFFFRASYLCKAATKFYGNGCHGFGASRV